MTTIPPTPIPPTTIPPTTIPAVLRARAQESPDSTFIHFEGQDFSRARLDEQSDRLASGLIGLGLGHGDRIAIAAANSPNWLLTYFAAAKIGAVLVTLHVAYREHEFTHMLTQSGARVLVCDAEAGGFEFPPFLERLRPQIPGVEQIVYLGDGQTGFADLLATEPNPTALGAAEARVAPSDPAIILYTSGTTGAPKGATLTHASLLSSAAAQAEWFGQTADDVILGVMPFNHVGGLTCTIGSSLIAGGSVALLPRFHPDLVLDALRQTGVTIFVGVPTMYKMVLAAGIADAAVRLCVAGGSNLEPALAQQVTEAFGGARIANLYGMSETSGACVISPPGDSLDLVGRSIGTMIGGYEGRIVDDEGRPVAPGETGELQVRGGCVADGYWEMPGESAESFGPGGWLATGDVGAMSEDGHISLFARKKEMYVRGGFNVYPAEIENVLARHPAVAMSAVIGVPDAVFGETGLAFVVPAPGAVVDPDELIDLCAKALAEYKAPSRIEVVDSLPMTPAGKIRKVALRPEA